MLSGISNYFKSKETLIKENKRALNRQIFKVEGQLEEINYDIQRIHMESNKRINANSRLTAQDDIESLQELHLLQMQKVYTDQLRKLHNYQLIIEKASSIDMQLALFDKMNAIQMKTGNSISLSGLQKTLENKDMMENKIETALDIASDGMEEEEDAEDMLAKIKARKELLAVESLPSVSSAQRVKLRYRDSIYQKTNANTYE